MIPALVIPKDLAAWQRLHVGPDGERLKDDGDLGPLTQWALDIESLPVWRQTVVLTALRFRLVREVTPNVSPDIDAWNIAARAPIGSRYCASFASMCLRAGGIEAREASCHRLAAMFPETDAPLPADLCFLLRPDGTGHVDVVTGAGAELVSVCGGNVDDGVRPGLRRRQGRTFRRVGPTGMPGAVSRLPLLGSRAV